MIGGGLALNDTGFILVQAMCPTSSLGRLVTLFLILGARSLQWGYKREGGKRGVREVRSAPVGRAGSDGSCTMSKCSSVCLEFEPGGSVVVS